MASCTTTIYTFGRVLDFPIEVSLTDVSAGADGGFYSFDIECDGTTVALFVRPARLLDLLDEIASHRDTVANLLDRMVTA